MPELPEVEAVRRELEPAMKGQRFEEVVLNRADLRTAFSTDFAERLEGKAVQSLQRRGKYLLVELSSDEFLIMHLGMSGSFRIGDCHPADRHDHVVFRMASGQTITFNDPRRFGFMAVVPRAALQERRSIGLLGPEPLSDEFTASTLAKACCGKKTSLKAALSDQRVVAGLGNIYVVEALHRAHLSPKRQASTIATKAGVPRETAERLVAAIKKVLLDAVDRGDGNRFRVYDREGGRCPTRGCRGVIKRITQAGRSTFFCPLCQR
jgi:formamidopyrimidine-DNA glycosylase